MLFISSVLALFYFKTKPLTLDKREINLSFLSSSNIFYSFG